MIHIWDVNLMLYTKGCDLFCKTFLSIFSQFIKQHVCVRNTIECILCWSLRHKASVIFILHLMGKKSPGVLCLKLQHKTLDIANTLDVSNNKHVACWIERRWTESSVETVTPFCVKHDIDTLNMNHKYVSFPICLCLFKF